MARGITCNYHTVPTHITHKKVNNDDTQRQQSIKTKSAPPRPAPPICAEGDDDHGGESFFHSPLHLSLSHCEVDRLVGGGAGADNDWQVRVSVLLLSCLFFFLSQISHIRSFSSST